MHNISQNVIKRGQLQYSCYNHILHLKNVNAHESRILRKSDRQSKHG